MSYIVRRSNGTTLVEIADQTVDTTSTSLALIGRGAPKYGQAVAEDFVHMLENFANAVAPSNPMTGQLWYDLSANILRIYNGTSWKIQGGDVSIGDTANTGPGTTLGGNTATGSRLAGAIGIVLTYGGNSTTVTALFSEGRIVAIVSAETITPNVLPATVTVLGNQYQVALRFPNGIRAGITLATDTAGYLFGGTSTSSQYADVAERYEASERLEAGDVIELGGAKEIQKSSGYNTSEVFGVISTAPAYLLNADAGTDETHPPVALTGRVPVKVIGPVKRNQRLVASHTPGVAVAAPVNANPFSVIGRALGEKTTDDIGLVEVAIAGGR